MERQQENPVSAHSMDTGDWVSQKDVTRFSTVLQLGQYKQADIVAFKVPMKTNPYMCQLDNVRIHRWNIKENIFYLGNVSAQ